MTILQYFCVIFGILHLVATGNYSNEDGPYLNFEVKARRAGRHRPKKPAKKSKVTKSHKIAKATTRHVTKNSSVAALSEADLELMGRQKSDLDSYGWDIRCRLQPIDYDCTGKGNGVTRFSYDIKMGMCDAKRVSNCEGNLNIFRVRKDCMKTCTAIVHQAISIANPAVRCRLQPDFGDCQRYVPSYYYDVNERMCRGFSYSGCCGNNNRFATRDECENVCLKAIDYSKTAALP